MATSKPLDGETALITGASAGIGRSSAFALANDGANVVVAARREDRLKAIAEEIEANHDVSARAVPTDVTEPDSVEELVRSTIEAFGALNVVVVNAGIGTATDVTVEDLPIEQYRSVMDVNTDGAFLTAQSALPHLRESEGTIVFVGSFAGNYPRPAAPVYAATKWWVRGFALSLAGQVGDEGVGVSLVHPSEVRTEFGTENREMTNREKFETGGVSEPEEVAEAVSFAAKQKPPNAVTELDIYRRDKFGHF